MSAASEAMSFTSVKLVPLIVRLPCVVPPTPSVNDTLPEKPVGPRPKLNPPSVFASLYCSTRPPAPEIVIGARMLMECQASRDSVADVFHDSALQMLKSGR